MQNTLGAYGEEIAAKVLSKAQEWVSRFTVVIGTTGSAKTNERARDMVPGSGVIVRLDDNRYGVLTAAHVLRRSTNTTNSVTVVLLAPPRDQTKKGEVMAIELPPRPCMADGFDNTSKTGPDIAIVPITASEWSTLEAWGMVAYNLNRERWSDEESAQFGEMEPWLVSVIHGVRIAASEIVEGHTSGLTGSLALMATNTEVKIVEEKGGHDYLELPSETTEFSYPTRWKNELPETAAEEIEDLHSRGVTPEAWGGTSGAGVWNLAIGTSKNGLPSGKVLAELTGICFYADPVKGCIIAHGPKSIARVAGLAGC